MNVISYRGPGAGGGVSSGLESNMNKHGKTSCWWFLKDGALSLKRPGAKEADFVTQIPDGVIDAHYRFCNEFLWPIMHDLPQFATYNPDDHAHYRRFNQILSEYVAFATGQTRRYFVQDYQFALLPQMLKRHGLRSAVFWHIPWPRSVNVEHLSVLKEIARGLLGSEMFGFHTDEYRDNFTRFVREHLPEFATSDNNVISARRSSAGSTDPVAARVELRQSPESYGQIAANVAVSSFSAVAAPYMTRPLFREKIASVQSRETRLVVHPLGIDVNVWRQLSQSAAPLEGALERFNEQPYILSVERADYTKGVLERMLGIELFFERQPDMIGKVTFLQICGRTRPGLKAFDRYWSDCQNVYERVNERFGSHYWRPIEWHSEHTSAAELALIYRNAQAMMVNPIRDGLNLTAKEFVACQPDDAGVLLLSPGAGAWHELGAAALKADPTKREELVGVINEALGMALPERRARISLLAQRIEANPLESWWRHFAQQVVAGAAQHADVEDRRRKIA